MRLPFSRQLGRFIDDVKDQFGGIFVLVCAVWAVFLLDHIPGVSLQEWLALRPRSVWGIQGIITMPFVHQGWGHIVSNTIPLVVMTLTLAALHPRTWWKILALIAVLSGLLTWIFGGADTTIVGASGVVLGLVTFLIAPGAFLLCWWSYNAIRRESKPFPFELHPVALLVSVVVGFFCLDNLVDGLIPLFPSLSHVRVSWIAHWCGAIAGIGVAWYLARHPVHCNSANSTSKAPA